ncbi:hypothetical protein BT93_J1635 [Corymbia citriodora subsp. variegata]|nr:hypothetical protein BT93_J1635 [Corymbia citriodora subsp. variegata]
METSLRFHHEHRLPTRPIHAPPPPRSANRWPLPLGHGNRAVMRADLNMRRAIAQLRFAICGRGFRDRRSILARHESNNLMATSRGRPLGLMTMEVSVNRGVQRGKEEEEEEEAKDEKKPAPAPGPPPETPLPGDCCGSGCVRCVWDVYYEELEAYKKSLRRDEGSGSNPNLS